MIVLPAVLWLCSMGLGWTESDLVSLFGLVGQVSWKWYWQVGSGEIKYSPVRGEIVDLFANLLRGSVTKKSEF